MALVGCGEAPKISKPNEGLEKRIDELLEGASLDSALRVALDTTASEHMRIAQIQKILVRAKDENVVAKVIGMPGPFWRPSYPYVPTGSVTVTRFALKPSPAEWIAGRATVFALAPTYPELSLEGFGFQIPNVALVGPSLRSNQTLASVDPAFHQLLVRSTLGILEQVALKTKSGGLTTEENYQLRYASYRMVPVATAILGAISTSKIDNLVESLAIEKFDKGTGGSTLDELKATRSRAAFLPLVAPISRARAAETLTDLAHAHAFHRDQMDQLKLALEQRLAISR